MQAVVKKFGQISFDLAAHSGNKKHSRYFAPTEFIETGTAEELGIQVAENYDVYTSPLLPLGITFKNRSKKKGDVYERKTPNVDPEAYGMDAFKHSWAEVSRKFGDEHPSGLALLWDNCEFAHIDPWAKKHLSEMRGSNSLLLTPLTTANWYRDHIAGKADVYHLAGRLCFDGKNVYPKDCMLSHYHPEARGLMSLWEWQKDIIHEKWIPEKRVIEWD